MNNLFKTILLSALLPALTFAEKPSNIRLDSMLELSSKAVRFTGPWRELSGQIALLTTALMMSPYLVPYNVGKPVEAWIIPSTGRLVFALYPKTNSHPDQVPLNGYVLYPFKGKDGRIYLAPDQQSFKMVEGSHSKKRALLQAETVPTPQIAEILSRLCARDPVLRAGCKRIFLQPEKIYFTLDFPRPARFAVNADIVPVPKSELAMISQEPLPALPSTAKVLQDPLFIMTVRLPLNTIIRNQASVFLQNEYGKRESSKRISKFSKVLLENATGGAVVSTDGSSVLLQAALNAGSTEKIEKVLRESGIRKDAGGFYTARLSARKMICLKVQKDELLALTGMPDLFNSTESCSIQSKPNAIIEIMRGNDGTFERCGGLFQRRGIFHFSLESGNH